MGVFVLVLALLATVGAAFSEPAAAAPPANDLFAAASELSGPTTSAFGTNQEATKETGEPAHAGNAGGASIWYRWTAPAAGRVVVSTCGSEFNTLIGVYTGDAVASLTTVAENDDACAEQSRLSFQAVAATTYRIAVDGFGGATGLVALSIDLTPPNDDFAASQQLSGESGLVNGTNVGATNEPGEPVFGARSVWFHWSAPSSGWATFATCGSALDTMLAAYTGSAVDQLTGILANDDGCNLASRISFQASAGTTYRIAVSGYAGEMGTFALSWNRIPPPPSPVAFPVVTGIARDGEMLTATDGAWSGGEPMTFSYDWGRCDRTVTDCEFIAAPNARTFTIQSADIGFRLWVRVTATNAAGSRFAYSDVTDVVVGRPPSNTASPVVEGEARLGAVLVAGPGQWAGSIPISYSYQWQTCDATGTTCSDIQGQTAQLMRVSSVEMGDLIRVVVTATNIAGSASAASPDVDVERAVTRARPRCVVPKLRGKTLRLARTAIRRNRCRMGRIQRKFSGNVQAGRVVSQTPRAGRRLAVGARINVVVSKGKRR
jgi:hypothetical protein